FATRSLSVGCNLLLNEIESGRVNKRGMVRFLPRSNDDLILATDHVPCAIDIFPVFGFVKAVDPQVSIVSEDVTKNSDAPGIPTTLGSNATPLQLKTDLTESKILHRQLVDQLNHFRFFRDWNILALVRCAVTENIGAASLPAKLSFANLPAVHVPQQ